MTDAVVSRRRPRILWVTVYCLLDTASGAAISARLMLQQLQAKGYDVAILGATVFDHEKGSALLRSMDDYSKYPVGHVFEVADEHLKHRLVATEKSLRTDMTQQDELAFFAEFKTVLSDFKPDVIYYYGGSPLNARIGETAQAMGVPVVFYLTNPGYLGREWVKYVDLMLTESEATADLYYERLGVRPTTMGCIIDAGTAVAEKHSRERLLFINPSLNKGVAIVVALAILLEKRRPDITIEVVGSRGDFWEDVLHALSAAFGAPRTELANVVFTPNTVDMRPVYGRARVLLAPSVWFECWGRVATEASLNGIPSLITSSGGLSEAAGAGGVQLELPAACFKPPYTALPSLAVLDKAIQFIEHCYDDSEFYSELSQAAVAFARTNHSLEAGTVRLMAALAPLVERRAGDRL